MGKKPTGYMGSITIHAEAAGIEHHQVRFPEDKVEIERMVIAIFDRSLDAATREYFGITSFEQSADENDLDCLVRSTNGDWRMDLVEFVPANLRRGGHDSEPGAPAVFNCGETADRMVDLIKGKAHKYAALNPSPWLIVYSTAWQFTPTKQEFIVVQHALINDPPELARVAFLWLHSVDDGEITTLYPIEAAQRDAVLTQDIARMRAAHSVMADLRGGAVVVEAGERAVQFPIGRVGDLFSKKRS